MDGDLGNLSNPSTPLFTPLYMENDNSESIKESGEDAGQTEDTATRTSGIGVEAPDSPAMPLQAPPEKSGPLGAPHAKTRKFKARAAPVLPKGKRKKQNLPLRHHQAQVVLPNSSLAVAALPKR